MGHFAGFFEGAETFLTPSLCSGQFWGQKGESPSKNPKKCPIICFAPDKKIISRTLKIRGPLVFLCPKERERERERERDRERERERQRERERGRER